MPDVVKTVHENGAESGLEFRIDPCLSAIDPVEWGRVTPASFPFADHAFLSALEASGSVGGDSGWDPHYVTLYDDGRLVGATYLYVKSHSYGEYVFDWAWAQAYERHGLAYYPKMISAVPFTPATGVKLMVDPAVDGARVRRALIRAAINVARQTGCSSLHFLFVPEDEVKYYEEDGLLIRSGVQFHWHNRGYADFDEFLCTLKARKRHEIRRERRRVNELPLSIELVTGQDFEPQHGRAMYELYLETIRKKMAYPYLTEDFFVRITDTFRGQALLLLARCNGVAVAGAIHFTKGDGLYGRYWGCHADYRHLHFELCYYRAIDWAIEHGISLFEAGAQGPHKIQRGFSPVLTYSAHWIADEAFRDAIAEFVVKERDEIEWGIEGATDHTAYRADAL